MSTFNYPLLFKPIPVPRPWGGGRLTRLYAREPVDSTQPIGESWDVSTWPNDPGNPELRTISQIINGPLAGTLLSNIVQVPVVVKLLDAAEKLSVQIHPVSDDIHKDEMWYILFAEPDAYLYCGLADGVTAEEFCQVVREGNATEEDILGKLKKYTGLKPGMHFNVPSGTVHAVGPGVVAYEVSECVQITYRLYDYNRGRQLHIDEGCQALLAVRNIGRPLNPGLTVGGGASCETITEFPTFCVVKLKGDNIEILGCPHPHLLTPTAGDCTIHGPSELWNVTVSQASTCLVPDNSESYNIDASNGQEILLTVLNM